jgi:hypothetical protein
MKPFAPKLDQPFEVDLKRVRRLIKDDDYKNLNKLASNWTEQSYHLKIIDKLKLFEKEMYIRNVKIKH